MSKILLITSFVLFVLCLYAKANPVAQPSALPSDDLEVAESSYGHKGYGGGYGGYGGSYGGGYGGGHRGGYGVIVVPIIVKGGGYGGGYGHGGNYGGYGGRGRKGHKKHYG